MYQDTLIAFFSIRNYAMIVIKKKLLVGYCAYGDKWLIMCFTAPHQSIFYTE